MRGFIARYNAEWLIEKNGHLSPRAMRQEHDLAAIPLAACRVRVSKEQGPVHRTGPDSALRRASRSKLSPIRRIARAWKNRPEGVPRRRLVVVVPVGGGGLRLPQEERTRTPPPAARQPPCSGRGGDRREDCDLLLNEAGWPLDQPRDREFTVTGTPNESGEGFVDYALWGDDGRPLALVEAKRTKKDARVGQQQAKLYADCLEKANGRRPAICSRGG